MSGTGGEAGDDLLRTRVVLLVEQNESIYAAAAVASEGEIKRFSSFGMGQL